MRGFRGWEVVHFCLAVWTFGERVVGTLFNQSNVYLEGNVGMGRELASKGRRSAWVNWLEAPVGTQGFWVPRGMYLSRAVYDKADKLLHNVVEQTAVGHLGK